MREAIGSTWTFQLMIVFILIFACFLSLVISYSKAFSLKNEMLTMVEKYEGISVDSRGKGYEGNAKTINNYLKQNGYQTQGKCPEGWYGVISLEENESNNLNNYALADGDTKYYYCFQEETYQKNESTTNVYYNIRLFYKFNLPVIGEITTFKVEGRTNAFIGNKERINYKK